MGPDSARCVGSWPNGWAVIIEIEEPQRNCASKGLVIVYP